MNLLELLNYIFANISFTILDLVAIALLLIHFGVPLSYYYYMKKRWLNAPWNIKLDPNYKPKITIIIPTYNEAKFIEKKLDNIYQQDYPRDKLEIIVVDSASTDGTPQLVKQWKQKHPDINLRLIEEPIRKGKLYSVLNALKRVSSDSEIVVLTDADAFWNKEALKIIMTYLADESVGVATGNIIYITNKYSLENQYRSFYNEIRIAESKMYSTPVCNGPLEAIKQKIINETGIPIFPGSDDSAFGSYIAFAGYRVIQIPDVWIYEPIRGNTIKRKIRRAQHIILNFLLTKRYAIKNGIYKKTLFDKIWKIEYFLTIINPWLLIIAFVFLTISLIFSMELFTTLLVILGVILLAVSKMYRVWIVQQIYLLIAFIRNIWTRQVTWNK